MNRAPLVLLLLAAAACVNHKAERIAATTADGRIVSIDSVTDMYDASGVRVIQRRNAANPVVAVDVYLLGGLREVTSATQGIERLALIASQYGTQHYPGGAARAAMRRTGSQVVIEPEEDWTKYGFRGVQSEFDSTWNVFADRLMHPALTARAVNATRERLIGSVRQRFNSPDGAITAIADSFAFQGHPYALSPSGVEGSLAALDSAALARFVAERMMRSRMLVVVVGDIDRPAIEQAIARTFAQLPAGDYHWTLPERAKLDRRVALVEREMPMNYVLGMYQGPPASAGDYASFRVAVAMLGAMVTQAVREERGMSYAAYAPFYDRGVSAGGLYASTNQPIATLDQMREQVQRMRAFPPDYPLSSFTKQFVLEYLAQNSTSAEQAASLARAQLYRGDYHFALKEMDDVRRVSTGSVAAASRRYFTNMRFVYLGDTTHAGEELRQAMMRVDRP
ncbi:MAG: M16 family metallopeptidase [Gemmatimonadaceae bacterium]